MEGTATAPTANNSTGGWHVELEDCERLLFINIIRFILAMPILIFLILFI
jgi:hypothetical protein